MCERIVSYFSDEGADEGERVYIQAFQDYVLDYCRTHTADLGSFLSWWDDNEDKLSVTTPQEQDAMRVMTIHKSKGLEFKVVIIPFVIGVWIISPIKPILSGVILMKSLFLVFRCYRYDMVAVWPRPTTQPSISMKRCMLVSII